MKARMASSENGEAVNHDPLLQKSKPVQCVATNCLEDATIIHGDQPLCGKHALERLEGADSSAKREGGGPPAKR
jgi:hypothetical protein